MTQTTRPVEVASITGLAAALGSTSFGTELAGFMEARFSADHVNCLTYSNAGGLNCMLNAGKVQDRWAQGLMQLYVQTYFRLDPNLEKVVMPLDRTLHTVVAFDLERLPSTQYRTLFWLRSPFADKCSLIFFDDSVGFYCNIYRSTGNVLFSNDDRMDVYALGKFVAGLLKAHFRLCEERLSPPEQVVSNVLPRPDNNPLAALSVREKVVMDLVLLGQTNEAIALDQGISINTVKTYRKRLYQKLNVSTLNQLHSRFGRSTAALLARDLQHDAGCALSAPIHSPSSLC